MMLFWVRDAFGAAASVMPSIGAEPIAFPCVNIPPLRFWEVRRGMSCRSFIGRVVVCVFGFRVLLRCAGMGSSATLLTLSTSLLAHLRKPPQKSARVQLDGILGPSCVLCDRPFLGSLHAKLAAIFAKVIRTEIQWSHH